MLDMKAFELIQDGLCMKNCKSKGSGNPSLSKTRQAGW